MVSISLVVVVQEERRLFRDGLALLLGRDDAVAEVVSTRTASDLVDAVTRRRPDAVVLPIDGAEGEAIDVVERLADIAPLSRVVGVHAGLRPGVARQLRKAGVTLVARSEGAASILAAVRDEGTTPAASRRRADQPAPSPLLTPREVDVLRLVAAGLTTREVSDELGISSKTIENHKQRAFWKLGVQNQAHAVAVAMRSGLLPAIDVNRTATADAC